MEPERGPVWGPAGGTPLNCSAGCGGGGCSIPSGAQGQEAWEILQQLCNLGLAQQVGVEVERRRISPVLCAVVWTLLSCGILLALVFLVFTLRFRNNRIVKMSSPNLNVLTLCGSILTYSSGFLFAIEEHALLPETSPRAAMQARIWTLCIGSSLVFGPILGKTWRIYRVFTQRLPDKRVIIRDLQLMGLVGLLILLDVLVLAVWSLTDPIQCAKSISAVVKVVEQDVFYSLSQLDSCSSLHPDIWIILFAVLKGSLLLYGTYLAGLTSDVSSPPVNQSPAIMAAVCLVTLSVAVAVPVSRLLPDWPNVAYSVVSGAIFICTLAINCLLFVPQLTQWRRFEDELNPNPSQMAKYFSTPSKSLKSMYSEDEIYYLLGENNSMKRLLTEKNAMIDSLQEQVSSAKDKLLRLVVVSSPPGQETDSSNTNLNSSSTQVTELPLESSGPLLEMEDGLPRSPSPPPLPPPPPPPLPAHAPEEVPLSAGRGGQFGLEGLRCDAGETQAQLRMTVGPSASSEGVDAMATDPPPEVAAPSSKDNISGPAPHSTPAVSPDHAGSSGVSLAVMVGGKPGFVSSEQLQEILQDLCVDAASTSLRSPSQARRTSNPARDDPPPRSSGSPAQSPLHPSISPYVMRRRRPPFRTYRAGPPPYCYPGSAPPVRRSVAPHGADPKTERVATETAPHPADAGAGDAPEEAEVESHAEDVPLRWRRCGPPPRCTLPPFSRCHPKPATPAGSREDREPGLRDPYDYSDSDSSSSEDSYCFYHRPYCSVCLQGPYASTESTVSETSDSEPGSLPRHCRRGRPVVNFNEDLKPTFV
ncbi:probable G-protein coupled receptor 156 [Anguilla anguilla]|uniref:probable G-protein coupled receptor 156 n=1 Tax=Anguilla anguilla TaxID=7936 RepID=UPI0015AF369B|nr:probable G-protein coupled receptor 156 [Anguilla anguilla]XP_035264119.1 probable G-protein coupled receptor 156 [Anguilla anguilla]XP_035264120.1 probable G-protein coupled receptor 156 [Anguilla anguilla]